MKFPVSLLVVLTILFSVTSAAAQTKAVVIPLPTARQLQNVVTVSPQGGDFTDPVAAVNSISGAGSSNPYLVMIGPGEYTLTQPLVMKPYVSVRGAGRDITTLTGSISSSTIGSNSAIVVGATFTRLSDLSIRNSGGGDYSIGIYNSNATYDITRIDVQAWGGGTGAIGTCGNYGMYNSFSSPRVADSLFYGSGKYAYGMYNDNSGPTLNRVELEAWVDEGLGCCEAYGISSANSSHPYIRYSKLFGASYGLQQSGGTAHVSFSTFTSAFTVDTGGGAVLTCVFNDDNSGTTLNQTCN